MYNSNEFVRRTFYSLELKHQVCKDHIENGLSLRVCSFLHLFLFKGCRRPGDQPTAKAKKQINLLLLVFLSIGSLIIYPIVNLHPCLVFGHRDTEQIIFLPPPKSGGNNYIDRN